jgi:hypothetical protein
MSPVCPFIGIYLNSPVAEGVTDVVFIGMAASMSIVINLEPSVAQGVTDVDSVGRNCQVRDIPIFMAAMSNAWV